MNSSWCRRRRRPHSPGVAARWPSPASAPACPTMHPQARAAPTPRPACWPCTTSCAPCTGAWGQLAAAAGGRRQAAERRACTHASRHPRFAEALALPALLRTASPTTLPPVLVLQGAGAAVGRRAGGQSSGARRHVQVGPLRRPHAGGQRREHRECGLSLEEGGRATCGCMRGHVSVATRGPTRVPPGRRHARPPPLPLPRSPPNTLRCAACRPCSTPAQFSSTGTRYPFRGMDVCSWATYALYLEATAYNFDEPGASRDPAVVVGHFVNSERVGLCAARGRLVGELQGLSVSSARRLAWSRSSAPAQLAA